MAYLLWAIYFGLSALQIRDGYPQKPYKPQFTKDVSIVQYLLFKTYTLIPFIWEMKVTTDWTFTKTTLDLFQWFKIDDAYNYIYFNRYQSASRLKSGEFSTLPLSEKFLMGFCFSLAIIVIILLPILVFSDPVLMANPVLDATVAISVELSNSQKVFDILQSESNWINQVTQQQIDILKDNFVPVDVKFD
mmetsp:Transcript_22704/g.17128  ORF Transcript_22704/g.17128 Transcript_22704/m.17128 type:complete len:190 (+) Transcript_22704:1573-2142(+)